MKDSRTTPPGGKKPGPGGAQGSGGTRRPRSGRRPRPGGAPDSGAGRKRTVARPPRSGGAPGRRRQNLWPRRIITGLGLILILALLIWGLLALIGLASAKPAAEDAQSAMAMTGESIQSGSERIELRRSDEVTRDGILTEDRGVRIPGCATGDLSITATATQTSVGAGESIALKITNTGRTACYTSLGRVDLAIRTGDELVYDSSRCESRDETATPLLLSPDEAWSGALSWDGRVYAEGCAAPEGGAPPAAAGTYRAQLSIAGSPVSGEQVFTVIEAPEPEQGAGEAE